MSEITALTKTQMKNIINNVRAACQDIRKLNKTGYNFLYQASGFIAHYNLEGFKDYYEEPGSLKSDILEFQPMNQWQNFRPGEQNYEYYFSKRICYNQICEILTR